MKQRVVIITEIIAPYRIPEFNALAAQGGIDLHVIFLAETDTTQRQWAVYKNELQFSHEVLASWRRRVRGYNFLLNWGMAAALRRSAPQVILCGGYNYFATWKALWWNRDRRLPFLLWSESNATDRRSGSAIAERLKRAFFKNCHGFVVPGSSARGYLTGYGIPAEHIFIAPNAVDNDLFGAIAQNARQNAIQNKKAHGLPDRYFLFAGRLVREKGIFDLLAAYRTLSPGIRSQVGLVFTGSGPAQGELQNEANTISPGTVKIAGFAQREQLAIYYGLADALVFPTHSDPWGLVVNEAMACGLPILATDVAGCVADMVKHGENGFISSVGDIEAFAKGMTALAEDPDLQQRMATASRNRIVAFSPDAWARGVTEAVFVTGQKIHGH